MARLVFFGAAMVVLVLPVCMSASRSTHRPSTSTASNASCAKLSNEGPYFTVQVTVGTPLKGQEEQSFDLVADTGSNNVIVPSCRIQKLLPGDRCFVGKNHSSTFHLKLAPGEESPFATRLTFGSGSIDAIVASDFVRVGDVSAIIEDSLFLMYDSDLTIDHAFEGIFGLGIPTFDEFPDEEFARADGSRSSETPAEEELLLEKPRSFFEFVRARRFSICFTDDKEGVLGLDVPKLSAPLISAGVSHWSLTLNAVHTGNASDVLICSKDSTADTQKSACAVIPDSGTTQILGPRRQVNRLLSRICDDWERCHTLFVALSKENREAEPVEWAAVPEGIRHAFSASNRGNVSKPEVLEALLADCGSWPPDEQLLLELPTIHFVVGGGGSEAPQTLELDARSYVARTKFLGRWSCQHMFGPFEYQTLMHGGVWILGTPLFFAYRVNYDIGTTQPSLSFASQDSEPCGACGDSGENVALVTRERDVASVASRSTPRTVWGQPRVPRLDTALPL